MLHVERLLALRELRAIVDVRCVCMSLNLASMDAGVRGGAKLEKLAAWSSGVKTTPGI
jgi:hypothetical protein